MSKTSSVTSINVKSPSPLMGAQEEAVSVTEDSGSRWAGLMILAQDGDRDAYHQLLSEITPYLRAIARRYLSAVSTDNADIEDAVQEVLLVVHSIRHTYERGRPFKPWLSTITSRRIIDLLRKRSHRDRHESIEEDMAKFEFTEGRQVDPAALAMQTSDANHLKRVITTLPFRQREAVELLRMKDMSLEDAATASKQKAGTLKVSLHRALNTLRDSFLRDK